MITITDPHEQARLSIAYNGCITYTDKAMRVIGSWAVAPMNWPHYYRVVVDGQVVGSPIFAPEGFWDVMNVLSEDLGVRS